MGVNVKGAFLTTQAVMRGTIRRRHGRILNISSSRGGEDDYQARAHSCRQGRALKGGYRVAGQRSGALRHHRELPWRPGSRKAAVGASLPEDGCGNTCHQLRSWATRHLCRGALGIGTFLVSDRNAFHERARRWFL